MHEDEERTLATLTGHRKITDELIVARKGKIFSTAGDSVLAEFPSVVEAYRCAVALQQALANANAEITEDARMEMRIGINVGDVMVTENDLLGDGVNIACRLWELAEPGGICVTRAARDQLRDRADTAFSDLGEHEVKNIARPVRVFSVVFDRNAEPELPKSSRKLETDTQEQKSAEAESAVEDTSVELAFWDTVRDGKNPAMLRAYLEKYPDGEFRSLAEILLGGSKEPVANKCQAGE